MLKSTRFHIFIIAILTSTVLSSCFRSEDPGPLINGEREFSVVDFDRLEMGSAFNLTVAQGDFFRIHTRGDRRNLDDLAVYKDGSTLVVKFKSNNNHRHTTYITITMPALRSANFSGASISTVSGFSGGSEFDLYLSGASVSQMDVLSEQMDLVVSGASNLTLLGEGTELGADVSGASVVNTFNWIADQVTVTVSGSSQAKVYATSELDASASGASMVYYRGNPSVKSSVSGSSAVVKDY